MNSVGKFISIILGIATFGGAQGATAYTIYNSIGGVENGGDPLAAAGPYMNDWVKISRASVLRSASFTLARAGAPTGSFDIWAAKLVPGGTSQYATLATVQDTSLTSSFATYTVKAAYVFDPHATYVVGLYNSNNSNAVWGNTIDPSVLARRSVTNGAY
jgi:hypothetical protein